MRKTAFLALNKDAWFKKIYTKLTVDELNLCINFLDSNEIISKKDFEFKVNRLFVDQNKPKHWKEILELLSAANS